MNDEDGIAKRIGQSEEIELSLPSVSSAGANIFIPGLRPYLETLWDVRRSLATGNIPIEESDEDKPGVIIDYDKEGNVVGVETLDASKRMENPRSVEFAVTS